MRDTAFYLSYDGQVESNFLCIDYEMYLQPCMLQIAEVKLLMELYKQMTAEAVSTARCKNVPEGQPLSGEKSQDTRASGKPSENKFPSGVSSEKAEDGQIQGTYVVGGSAFGWNFITFLGSEPVYCGITKESFRANGSKATVS